MGLIQEIQEYDGSGAMDVSVSQITIEQINKWVNSIARLNRMDSDTMIMMHPRTYLRIRQYRKNLKTIKRLLRNY